MRMPSARGLLSWMKCAIFAGIFMILLSRYFVMPFFRNVIL